MDHLDKIGIIAYYTFIEAIRNRMFLLMVVGLVCLLGIAEFTGELAITETREIQSVLVASIARWFVIMTSALFVITSMVREFNDKGVELILSLPVSRAVYYFGKYLGFLSMTLVVSLPLSLVLLLYTDVLPLAAWLFSLLCETSIIVALSILCLFTFSNVTVAFVVVISFYLLSRSMEAIQLLSTSPILESRTWSQEFMNTMIDAIAFVIPDLNRFTNSEWLVYGFETGQLVFVILQTVIYLAILIPAGLFDLFRKEM